MFCQDCEFDQLNINNVCIIKREILLYMCDKEKCLCESIYLWRWGVLVFWERRWIRKSNNHWSGLGFRY